MRATAPNMLATVQDFGSYEEATIVSGGAAIVLSIWLADPQASTVLFLPGTMTHPLFYQGFLQGLNHAGFNVVGVHFVGHGKSPRIASFTFEDLLQNARDALSYAKTRFSGPVVALGSSQGGILAMALAACDQRLAAVFAHNILDPKLPDALEVTRFPKQLKPYQHDLVASLQKAARLLPQLPVPVNAYLSPWRITRKAKLLQQLATDPLGLHSYPLGFVASLFSADLSGMYDGRIRCPVVVLASSGDPLFPFAQLQALFERIVAPSKELLVFGCDTHLLFNECIPQVLPRLVEKLKHYSNA